MSTKGIPALMELQLAPWRRAIRKEFGLSTVGVRNAKGLRAETKHKFLWNGSPPPNATLLSATGLPLPAAFHEPFPLLIRSAKCGRIIRKVR